jgi:hypothetical protein
MKLSKLIVTIVGATVLLGALVSSASARSFSLSSQAKTILWRRMDFISAAGNVECEVNLSGSFHTRTFTKTVNSLIGYLTEGAVLRCANGGATLNQSSLPWHLRYRGFTGTLPNMNSQSATVTGAEWTIRSGIVTCTVRRETSSTTITYTIGAGGVITRADISGTCSCSGFNTTISGGETNVLERIGGARITVRLI